MAINWGKIAKSSLTAAAPDIATAIGTALFGTRPTVTSGTQSSGFDMGQLANFNQLFGQAAGGANQLAGQIQALNAPRQASLNQGFDRQMNLLRGIFGQEQANINQRYNSAYGGSRQRAASTGLYNTSVLPGMQALSDRERNRALGELSARQGAALAGVEGQRTSALDAAQQQAIIQQLAPLMQLFSTGLLPAQTAGSSTVSRSQQTSRKKGLLDKLFG